MGQWLVHYKDIWSIGTLPIETSPDPFHHAPQLINGQPLLHNIYVLDSH